MGLWRSPGHALEFLATSGDSIWMIDVAKILHRRMGAAAAKVPTEVVPNWNMRLVARKDPSLKGILPILGANLNVSGKKAEGLLGWKPRSPEEATVATAESLVRLRLLNA